MTRKNIKICSKEAAVSEAVGYIILFAIMMTGIGLVTLYGYPLLLEQQENANIRNMERNMIMLQTDVNSLTFKNVPYKETTLQISGGVLSVEKEPNPLPYFEFDFPASTNSIPPPLIDPLVFTPGKLRFVSDHGGTIIVLENGAVSKRYENNEGSVMISPPRWYYDQTSRTFVIPLINITATNDFAKSGIVTIQMNLTDSKEIIYDLTAAGSAVQIKYYNDYSNDTFYDAWNIYMTKEDLKLTSDTSNKPFDFAYKMDSSVERVAIKISNISVIGF